MIVDQSKDVIEVTAKASRITMKAILAFLKKVSETIERNKTEVSTKAIIKKAKDMNVGVETVDIGADQDKMIAIRNQLAKDGIMFSIEPDHDTYILRCLAPYSSHTANVINNVVKDFQDKGRRINKLEKFKAAKVLAKKEKAKVMERIKNHQKNFSKDTQGGR